MNAARLIFFPFCEIIFFALGIYFLDKNILWSLFFGFIAALALNFSLHISVHYHVHFKFKNRFLNTLTDFFASMLIGIPFHYYQMTHWNHHRYNNELGDFTTTWRTVKGETKPKNFFRYSFLWPFAGSIKFSDQIVQALREGYFNSFKYRVLKLEGMVNLLLITSLFYLSTNLGFLYLFIIYSGWCMISMHNYGQHLPEKYGELKANSYYHKLYNYLFINNGWHLEHHIKPGLKYWELHPEFKGKIKHPHLVEGLFFFVKSKKEKND